MNKREIGTASRKYSESFLRECLRSYKEEFGKFLEENEEYKTWCFTHKLKQLDKDAILKAAEVFITKKMSEDETIGGIIYEGF